MSAAAEPFTPPPSSLHPPNPVGADELYRKFAIAAAVFTCTFMAGYYVVSGWPAWSVPSLDVTGISFGHDFINTWLGAKSVFSGGPVAWFDVEAYNTFLQSFMGPDFWRHFWSYPPHVLLFIWPFGLMPYFPAYLLWCALGLVLYLAACWRTVRSDQLLFLAAAPAVAMCVLNGQNGTFTAALLIGGLLNIERRPVLAGVLFGLLTLKPQLGFLLPIVLVMTGRWRVIVAAVATSALLVGLTTLWFGVDIWVEFFHKVVPQQRWLLDNSDGLILLMVPSALYSVRLLRLSSEWAWAIQYAVSAFALAAVIWTYWRKRDPMLSMALFLTAVILFTPYSLNYDEVILAWAVAVLQQRDDNTRFDHWLGILVWTLPVSMLVVSGVTHLPFAIFVLLAFAGRLIWRLAQQEPIAQF